VIAIIIVILFAVLILRSFGIYRMVAAAKEEVFRLAVEAVVEVWRMIRWLGMCWNITRRMFIGK
jgi:hypothetical protein